MRGSRRELVPLLRTSARLILSEKMTIWSSDEAEMALRVKGYEQLIQDLSGKGCSCSSSDLGGASESDGAYEDDVKGRFTIHIEFYTSMIIACSPAQCRGFLRFPKQQSFDGFCNIMPATIMRWSESMTLMSRACPLRSVHFEPVEQKVLRKKGVRCVDSKFIY